MFDHAKIVLHENTRAIAPKKPKGLIYIYSRLFFFSLYGHNITDIQDFNSLDIYFNKITFTLDNKLQYCIT